MKVLSQILTSQGARWVVVAFALVGMLAGLRANTVVAPAKRQESLAQAKQLLGDKAMPSTLKNPFSPEGFGEGQAESGSSSAGTPGPVVQAGPRSGRDLLQAIGASLKPSGSLVLGGEPVLMFGQKRVKAGGTLTITFEGNEYTLEIVKIERPNFTLRLNREEFTRPIK